MNSLTQRSPEARTGSPGKKAIERRLASIPADAYGVLGVELRLRTDSEEVRSFFAHAYRWFPPQGRGPIVDLAAVFDPQVIGRPFALAGSSFLDLSESPSPGNQAFLFLLESIMDSIDSCILLHAGAVAFDGRGIILAGPALAGKSTLVQALMGRGHDFMSDDAAPLDRSSGRLLPFPRAIGIRKGSGEGRPPVPLPLQGVHELPYRWLVDPELLGARLPASECPPGHLFYLDPGGGYLKPPPSERSFEIALAGPDGKLRQELIALAPSSQEDVPGRPFTTILVRFAREAQPVSDLMTFWRRNRDQVLYMEEVRPPAARTDGKPEIESIETTSLLLPLVRDILNRGDRGRLMTAHGGRVTSLTVELGGLLHGVNCYRITSGSPDECAAAITDIVSAGDRP